MRRFSLAFGILLMVSACAGQSAMPLKSGAPKPVLVLSEWVDWGGAGHPWPIELRLVAYDNGVVIRQPVMNDHPLTKPRFVWQQKTPDEVSALVAEAKAALEGIQATDDSVPLPPDIGLTEIEYRDSERAANLVRVTANGWPCAAKDSDAQVEWKVLMRSATHPRFLKLCNDLLGLPLAGAKEWYPHEMTVTLITVKEHPDKIVPWPEAWPREWLVSDQGDYKTIELCVPVGPRPDELTAQILDPQSEVWSQSIAVEQDEQEWWVVIPFAAKISMPGTISPSIGGPCSTHP